MPENTRKKQVGAFHNDAPLRCKTFTLLSEGALRYGIETINNLDFSSHTLRHQKGLRDARHILVKIDLKLTDDQVRSFKRGDPRPRVYSGITGTACVITTSKTHAVVRMQYGDTLDVFYPDGRVTQVQMCGLEPSVFQYESVDSVEARIKGAEERLEKSHSMNRQTPVYIDLIRLIRLQKEKMCIEKILEFFGKRTITAKVESCLRTALEDMGAIWGFTFKPLGFQKVTKERVRASSRRENRHSTLFSVTQHTMAVTRVSGQRTRTLRQVG